MTRVPEEAEGGPSMHDRREGKSLQRIECPRLRHREDAPRLLFCQIRKLETDQADENVDDQPADYVGKNLGGSLRLAVGHVSPSAIGSSRR